MVVHHGPAFCAVPQGRDPGQGSQPAEPGDNRDVGIADEELMSAEQQAQLRAVVDAINRGVADIYQAVAARISPPPPRDDITAVQRILELPAVAFQRGERADVVVARVLDLLETAAEGGDHATPNLNGADDRY